MAEAARWGRWTLLPMVVGAGAAMAAQATPPLHVPTHEFTQLFAALAGLGWLLTVRGARMSSAHEVLFSGLIGGFWGILDLLKLLLGLHKSGVLVRHGGPLEFLLIAI